LRVRTGDFEEATSALSRKWRAASSLARTDPLTFQTFADRPFLNLAIRLNDCLVKTEKKQIPAFADKLIHYRRHNRPVNSRRIGGWERRFRTFAIT
jgi:hypothetical protein